MFVDISIMTRLSGSCPRNANNICNTLDMRPVLASLGSSRNVADTRFSNKSYRTGSVHRKSSDSNGIMKNISLVLVEDTLVH